MKIVTISLYHQRLIPFSHSFAYRIFALYFNLNENLPDNLIFGRNKLRLISFFDSDHGGHNDKNLFQFMANMAIETCGFTPDRIDIMAMPRIFNGVFNPISFFFCYQGLHEMAIIVEVHNTFGEHHFYVIPAHNGVYSHKKIFHVSPFLPREGSYNFTILHNDNMCDITIDYCNQQGQIQLKTGMKGQMKDYNIKNLLRAWWQSPLLSVKVLWSIHLQAIILYFGKKAKFYKQPTAIKPNVS